METELRYLAMNSCRGTLNRITAIQYKLEVNGNELRTIACLDICKTRSKYRCDISTRMIEGIYDISNEETSTVNMYPIRRDVTSNNDSSRSSHSRRQQLAASPAFRVLGGAHSHSTWSRSSGSGDFISRKRVYETLFDVTSKCKECGLDVDVCFC